MSTPQQGSYGQQPFGEFPRQQEQYPQGGFAPESAPPRPRPPWLIPVILASVIAVSAFGALIASLFSLYSISIEPSKFVESDAPNGEVTIGIGFYDTLPVAAPTVAVLIPILLVAAGVTAAPTLLRRTPVGAGLSALFAVPATLIAIVLAFANPVPGVELSGSLESEFASELANEGVRFSSVNDLIGQVLNIGPGVGLWLTLVFGIFASAAAVWLFIISGPSQPAQAAQFGPAFPPNQPFGPRTDLADAPYQPEQYSPAQFPGGYPGQQPPNYGPGQPWQQGPPA